VFFGSSKGMCKSYPQNVQNTNGGIGHPQPGNGYAPRAPASDGVIRNEDLHLPRGHEDAAAGVQQKGHYADRLRNGQRSTLVLRVHDPPARHGPAHEIPCLTPAVTVGCLVPRPVSDLSQRMSMVWLLPLMICSLGRGGVGASAASETARGASSRAVST